MAPRLRPEAARELDGLTLAYLGDAVYELLVRDYLLSEAVEKPAKLHKKALALVSAPAQFEAYRAIAPLLTAEEEAVFARGRNAKLSGGKSHDPAAHCHATGLEALFGYLHLRGETERLEALFDVITEALRR